MSSETPQGSVPVVSGPGVPYSTFLGLSWAGAAVSTVFLAFRLVARWRGQRRLFWDDACSVFAGALVIITASLWQWAARDVYYVLNVAAGLAPIQADFTERLSRGLEASLIVELFFYTSLFVVKISFLLFFRRLGSNVRGQGFVWWPALVLSVVCYLVSVGDVQYECLVNATTEHLVVYCTSPEAIRFTTVTLIINCVLDVLSDVAILLIPFTLLWNVRIHRAKKLAFLGLFSLSLVTIAVAIARTADLDVTKKSNNQQDSSYLWMWSVVQSSLAVSISCLSAFPQLFTPSSRSAKPQWTPTDTYYQRLKSRMKGASRRRLDPLYDVSAFTLPDRDVEADHGEGRCSVDMSGIVKPVGQCSHSNVSHEAPEQKSQIMRHMEYRVTEQQNAETQMSPEGQSAYARETANGWESPQGGNGFSYGSGITGHGYQEYRPFGN